MPSSQTERDNVVTNATPSNSNEAAINPQDANLVTIDRRRAGSDRRAEGSPAVDSESASKDGLDTGVVKAPRRKKQRRRHIDPTTCERDYSDPEIEFMRAMDDYKRRSGRMFPTCSEVLEVIRDLGYVKLTEAEREHLGVDCDEDGLDALDADATDDESLDSDPTADEGQ
jgi:hypothetical protein